MYLIKNQRTQLYMGIADHDDGSAARVEQQKQVPEGARESQLWRLSARKDKDAKEGDYFLTNVKSDLRLHVAGDSTAPSAFVEVYNEDAPTALKSSSWRITEEKPKVPAADGQPTTYAIANSRSEWWLNIRNYEHTAGTRIEQWVLPEHGGRKSEGRDYALWIFEPAGPKDVGGTSTAPQEESVPKETTPPVRCGGKFDSVQGDVHLQVGGVAGGGVEDRSHGGGRFRRGRRRVFRHARSGSDGGDV
ncbi:RICIN domain-containing protein [Streptomyces lydicus]|uniref:RICIN domain-containing protein n=1 Tax=Streptomyces lydicus TaxID=47763 RepID=UPI00379C7D38